jgi:O-antigen ligase
MVRFLERWIWGIAEVIYLLIIQPMLRGTLILAAAAVVMAALFALFWFLPVTWALGVLLALALIAPVTILLIIKDANPPTHWP